MAASKIMIIRHGEKPEDGISGTKKLLGVDESGANDPESLIVRGWQRAGALARLFAPAAGAPLRPGLETPNVLFASAVAPHSHSRRPQQTISVLQQLLGAAVTTDYSHPKGGDLAMAAAAMAANGIVLISWEHEVIPDIANLITGNQSCPQKWPGERFDLVWVFARSAPASPWQFTQVPQLVLSGDSTKPI